MWLDQLPFATVERLLHLVYAEMDNWKFSLQEAEELDYRIFKQYLWTSSDFSKDLIHEQSVVLVVQPPWVLSADDLGEFAKCRNVSLSF